MKARLSGLRFSRTLHPSSFLLLRRLVEQILDHLLEHGGLVVVGADGEEADAAPAVYEDGGRDRDDAVAAGRLLVVRDAEAVGDALPALELPQVLDLLGARK